MDAVFSGSVIAMGGGVIFSALLGWACVSDLRTRRIPNRLVAVLAIGGLLFSLFAQRGGVPSAVAGLLVGFALWFPVYVLGAATAHDHMMISQMPDLATTPGAISGPKAFEMAGIKADTGDGQAPLGCALAACRLGHAEKAKAWAAKLPKELKKQANTICMANKVVL